MGVRNLGILVHGVTRAGHAIPNLVQYGPTNRILDDWILQSTRVFNSNETGKILIQYLENSSKNYGCLQVYIVKISTLLFEITNKLQFVKIQSTKIFNTNETGKILIRYLANASKSQSCNIVIRSK